MGKPLLPATVSGVVVGAATGAALIAVATRYEQVAYAHDVQWAVLTALCAGAALGVAAWAATGTEYGAVGWATAVVIAVHIVTGTLTAERQALHDRGVEVTAVVRQEHVHRLSGSGTADTVTYVYERDVPGNVPAPWRRRRSA